MGATNQKPWTRTNNTNNTKKQKQNKKSRIHEAHARVALGNYSLSGLVGRQLKGRTAAVLGTGAIGAEAARILQVREFMWS